MRWPVNEKEKTFTLNLDWHKWFAWFPVNDSKNWYWLEYVDRKINIPLDIRIDTEYTYRGRKK